MPKKSKIVSNAKSSLAVALESGKDIKGMLGYISIEDKDHDDVNKAVFIKVKALGLSTEGCGLKVLISPVSGQGQMEISPCRWLESPEAIADMLDVRKRQTQAEDDYHAIYRAPHYFADKVLNIENYAKSKLDEKQYAAWKEHVEATLEKVLNKSSGELSLKRVGTENLKKLAQTTVLVANGLDATQRPELYEWKD